MDLRAAASVCVTLALAVPAWAQQQYPSQQQPYQNAPPQGYYQPPAQQPAQPPDPYGQQPQGYYDPSQQQQPGAYDPGDQDPDIDGYDAETDVTYDNDAAQSYDDGYDPNAYTQFESALDPYGTWVNDDVYGRVWVPSSAVVGDDFFPYASGGYWALTEFGWTWVSDWDWGWGPFHYGRWSMIGGYGWCWIPGSVWGPAWVSWRSGGGYVGWSPLPPAGVTIGPPTGVRSGWRFTLAGQLGTHRMTYLPAHVVPRIFARTSVVSNARSVTVGRSTVRVNAGPTALTVGRGVGVSTPVSLRTIAPRALPHQAIVTRNGAPLASRPWVRAGVGRMGSAPAMRRPISIPVGPQHSAAGQPIYNARPQPLYNTTRPQPMYNARPQPTYNARPNMYVAPSRPVTPARPYAPYRAPSYQAPAYRYSAPAYRAPSYQAPAYRYNSPVYRAPSYSAPSYRYNAPSYHYNAPSYHYSAPSYHYSAPSSSHHYSAPAVSHPAIRRR